MVPGLERIWRISNVCESFHCLPLAAIRELERDPEHLAEIIPTLRAYAHRKSVFDHADNDQALKPYANDRLMGLVKKNTLDRHKARVRAAKEAKAARTTVGGSATVGKPKRRK